MKRAAGHPRSILLLGAGELGREIAIAARHIGIRVVAVDRVANAPAMHVADAHEVVSAFEGAALEGVVRTHRPDLILPIADAVRAPKLAVLEAAGYRVAPGSAATALSTDGEALRRVAAEELGLPTPTYRFADSDEGLRAACDAVGYPCAVVPVTSPSGRGRSIVSGPARVDQAWEYAKGGDRGERPRVMVEAAGEDLEEITVVVVRGTDGSSRVLDPIGHRDRGGKVQESWMPAAVREPLLADARRMAVAMAERLGGAGVFAAELLMSADKVLFSTIAPRPRGTGLVTLVAQDLSQFELHLRSVCGLPVPHLTRHGPSAAAVILADREGAVEGYEGLQRALQVETVQVRLFGKATARWGRRMGVSLARGATLEEARSRALEAASRVQVRVA